MFYVNYEPEGKFLYTETIKLYYIVLYCRPSETLCDSYVMNFFVVVFAVVLICC